MYNFDHVRPSNVDDAVQELGAGENGVFRSPELEAALTDIFSSEALAGVSIPTEGLTSDMHGSADYRAALVVAMAQEAVGAAG